MHIVEKLNHNGTSNPSRGMHVRSSLERDPSCLELLG